MSIEVFRAPRLLRWILTASATITVFACNRYPSSPRDVVVKFVEATQIANSDAKAYLSASFKSTFSGKGFKYTFGEAEVLQSVPQANGKYAILIRRVRLGGGGVVTATDMRVNAIRENDHWVISGLVAGLTNPGGSANNSWLSADGIPIY